MYKPIEQSRRNIKKVASLIDVNDVKVDDKDKIEKAKVRLVRLCATYSEMLIEFTSFYQELLLEVILFNAF